MSCSHMFDPLHMLDPLHSLHALFLGLWGQMPDPRHSLYSPWLQKALQYCRGAWRLPPLIIAVLLPRSHDRVGFFQPLALAEIDLQLEGDASTLSTSDDQ